MVILLPPLLSLCSLSLPAPVPSWLSRMVLLHRVLTHLGPVLLFWVFLAPSSFTWVQPSLWLWFFFAPCFLPILLFRFFLPLFVYLGLAEFMARVVVSLCLPLRSDILPVLLLRSPFSPFCANLFHVRFLYVSLFTLLYLSPSFF
jgi:hypothetical protein